MGGRAPFVDVEGAVRILRAGGLVGLPTETVYGLAADATQPAAVRRIFETKGRPPTHPLIVHVPSAEALSRWSAWSSPSARRLADALWPGPLTLVLPRAAAVLDEVTGGLPSVAVRVPAHPLARAVLEGLGAGIAAPSANRFGAVSPTTAEHVQDELGDRIDGILDGGPCDVGIESTIVDVTGDVPRVLRPGGVSVESLQDVLGAPVLVAGEDDGPRAPGRLASHYAPRARVSVVDERDVAERVRAWTSAHPDSTTVVLAPRALPEGVRGGRWVEVPEDPRAWAQTLYADLRALDAAGVERAFIVLPVESSGLGMAIRDRLLRAAGPR